jgi:hypothetical protein
VAGVKQSFITSGPPPARNAFLLRTGRLLLDHTTELRLRRQALFTCFKTPALVSAVVG